MLLLFILLVFLSLTAATFGSTPLRGSICYKYIPQVVTYQQRVLYTELVRTRKCRFLLFCRTAYRTRERYRLERRTKTIQKMQLECCKGYHEVNKMCVADEVPTTAQTISEDTNQRTGAWTFRNTSESILIGKNKELRITKSSSSTFIIAIVACSLFVFTVITLVVIVLRKRLKKMAACTSEIPYTPDVMLPPSKSTNEYSVPQALNCQNFSPKEENSYISMENGCKLQVPSVKMMLATHGSRYRLDSLEGSRHYSNSMYMAPDPATYTNQNVQVDVGCQDQKCLKTRNDKSSSDIYINGGHLNMADKILDEDEENIYSEIRDTFNQTDLVENENYYSSVRTDRIKELTPEERQCMTGIPSDLSLHECGNSNANNNNIEMESMLNSQQTNASNASLTQTSSSH